MQNKKENVVEESPLLSQINKSATRNDLLNISEGSFNTDLSDEQIAQLVDMIKENVRKTERGDIDSVADYAYDLISDVPGLEDEFEAQQAVKTIMAEYQRSIA